MVPQILSLILMAVASEPLAMEVHVSRTAHLFHVVDQIAEWDVACHGQYRAHLQDRLTPEDEALLKRHVQIRRKRGWGGGLEQTFYTAAGLDEAIEEGILQGHLTPDEGATEKEVLLHFAPIVDEMMEKEMGPVEAFRKSLEDRADTIQAFARTISRFCHGAEIRVPVYLMVNPSDHRLGGGYNGERLTLEIPRKDDPFPTFLHEIVHAFVWPERQRLEQAVEGVPGLDLEGLNEGIAYAVAPGIHSNGGDPLAKLVGREITEPLEGYVRSRRFGLALRPLMREALADEAATLEAFLPRAIDTWMVVRELAMAREAGALPYLSAGPGYEALQARLRPEVCFSFNHNGEHYDSFLPRLKRGGTFVLLFALDHGDREVPVTYVDLLPRPWSEVKEAMEQGKTVDVSGEVRGHRILILAAPTVRELEKLIRETDSLD